MLRAFGVIAWVVLCLRSSIRLVLHMLNATTRKNIEKKSEFLPMDLLNLLLNL